MFEAILVFSPHSSLFSSYDRRYKIKIHWILNIAANVCIFLGFAAIYLNKNLNKKPHFTSWHGTLGLVSVILVLIQSFFALSLIYYNVSWLNPLRSTLAIRKKLHAVSGCMAFIIGYTSLVTSLYSNFIKKNTGEKSWYLLLILMSIITSVVVNQVSAAYIYKGNRVIRTSGNIRVEDDTAPTTMGNIKMNSTTKEKSSRKGKSLK